MAYFSNGTEGDMYREEYCDRCVHDGHGENDCPIWSLHLLYNYDQCKDKTIKGILDKLIPRNGIRNEQCKMFLPFVQKPAEST